MTILKIFKNKENNSIYIDFQKIYFEKIKKERLIIERFKKIKEEKRILKKNSKKTYIDEYGYRRFIDSKKLVSRYVAQKKLGRKLRPEEVVHHIDGYKLNNNAENLWVFPNQEEHHNHHKKNLYVYGSWYKPMPIKYTYST